MGRSIFTSLKLDEISGVDNPAQEHARVAIMKRHDATKADPVSTTTKGIEVMDAKEVQKLIDDAVKAATADLTKKLTDTEARLAKADMSDKHSNFMNNDDATMPKGGKSAFMSMSPSERDDHMDKNPIAKNASTDPAEFAKAVAAAAANDEVLKIGDTEVRKSKVGADTFSIFKAQQAEIQKAHDARELVELQKRAESEFGNLPGEAVAKARVLKAVKGMPDAERTELEKMLKGGNAALATLMKAAGHDGAGIVGGAVEQMNAKAEEYRKGQAALGKTLSPQQAFAKVYEDPANVDLKKAYHQEEVAKRAAAA